MSRARLWAVCRLDLLHYARRPLFWIWLAIVALCTFGLSSGNMSIQAGDSSTGGLQAHITSAYANGLELALLGALFYTFFVAVASGMELIRDRELRIESLLHSTPMRASEYVWGKFGASLVVAFGILAFQLGFSMLLKHLVTVESQPELIGTWSPLNYLQPALLFAVPLILFTAGLAFAIGEFTRKPVLVNMFPLALLLASIFLFWLWTPTWLDPSLDRALMLIDPTGFRWLNETWLSVDRGADFYNGSRIGFDPGFVLSRLVMAALGLGAVFASQRHLHRTLRGARVEPSRVQSALASASEDRPRPVARRTTLAELGMRTRRPGFLRATLEMARVELKILGTHPGVWLFLPLIVLNAIFDALYSVGAFDTLLLLTPGRSAVGSLNELTFALLLFLMVFMVEALRREESTRVAPISYATPLSTRALILGKLLAVSLLAVLPMVAVYGVCAIVQAVVGEVPLDAWPYLLVFGLLLFPVVLIWNAFVTLVYALTRNRFATYAIAFGAMIGTGIQLALGHMSWTWNWSLVGALRWTDLGPFELDRLPLTLNRLMAIATTALFLVVAVRIFPRRRFDSTRVLLRLRPSALAKTTLRLSPWILVPIALGITLQKGINAGPGGERYEKQVKDYWRKNHRTWLDRPGPELAGVTLELDLVPAERRLHSRGEYTLRNPHAEPLREIALTGAPHWESLACTLDGEAFEPDDREGLHVFTLPEPLATGDTCVVGFDFEGVLLDGFSKNGARSDEFITDSSIVLTSFSSSMAPLVGYVEMLGIDEDNRYDSREYTDDFYEGHNEPAFGASTPFPVRVTVTAPERYRMNSVGVLLEDTVRDGLRTMRWQSDEPVRFFNVVGGLWDVRRGEGTAIYHHPAHTYNLDEMIEAVDGAKAWFSEWFYPYPWDELRISEFASYAAYAQGFPTNITFSEDIGFLTEDDEGVYLSFAVTAHESAHQWWGNILMPGQGPGGNLLAEGTSHFSTMLLIGQIKGLEARIEFCKRLEERYNEQRVVDSERELVKVDGSKDGDTTLTYDKMGWACWMLHEHLGADQSFAGLRAFFERFAESRDHPLVQDFLLHMRGYADDPDAYDEFVAQWFYRVELPEYSIRDPRVEGGEVRFTLENSGQTTMPVEIAVERGTRFPPREEASQVLRDAATDPFEEVRARRILGPETSVEVAIPCSFEPERIVIDPDALILQRGRQRAIHRF